MRRGTASLLIGLSLLFMQISGVHLHVCQGFEARVDHPRSHYADRGFIFGDAHSDDDDDDQEVELPGGAALSADAKPPSPVLDFYVLPPQTFAVEPQRTIVAFVATRGPPADSGSTAPYVIPPARGPPAHS